MLSKLHKTVLFFFLTLNILAQTPSNPSELLTPKDTNQSMGNVAFTHTYWKLITLSNEGVDSTVMTREAHIIFQTLEDGKGKFKGASGCNAMLGTYQSSEQNLTIDSKHIAMTRMACPQDDIEMDFLKAIQGTVKWHIKGNHLEFKDINATTLAEFKSTNLQ